MFGHDDQSQHHQDDNPATTNSALLQDSQISNASPVDDISANLIDSTPTSAPPIVATPFDPTATTAASAAPTTPVNTDALLDIKQLALQQLTPLIGHLEQNPEEKFRTTMMMIQAADNDSLIKSAYDAAIQIPDEKVRAQALLDIVNEINYFTHNSTTNEA